MIFDTQSDSCGCGRRPRKMQLGGEAYIARPPLSPLPARRGFKSWCSSPTTGPANIFAASTDGFWPWRGTLLLGLVLAVAISRSVTRPLETLVAGTRALGQGDFDYELRWMALRKSRARPCL